MSKVTTCSKCSVSALTGPKSFYNSFVATSIIRSKSAQKFAARVCQVATVTNGNLAAGSKPI